MTLANDKIFEGLKDQRIFKKIILGISRCAKRQTFEADLIKLGDFFFVKSLYKST